MADTAPAFVTYGWCRSSYAAVRSLGRHGIPLHVGDSSPLAMCRYSRYTRSFSRLPDFFSEPDAYVDAVIAAMSRVGARVLLPCHEDVGVFCHRRDRLPSWVQTALPEPDNYDLANDKRSVVEYARSLGVPTPRSRRVLDESQLDDFAVECGWPIVVKTHVGNSAKGVRIVHDVDELKRAFHSLVRQFELSPDHWPFLEEFLPGRACGACLLLDRGRVVARFAEEYLRCKGEGRFGTSTFRQCMPDPHLVLEPAERLLTALRWHGVAHCDFIADAGGQFRLIEVNPRLWGATWLSVAAGVDVPHLWYRLACGETLPEAGPAPANGVKCRWLLGDIFSVAAMATRGRLLQALRCLAPVPGAAHDDWTWRDPLPLAFQLADYLGRSVRMGGVNPAAKGMIR